MGSKKHSMTSLKDVIANLLKDDTLPFNPDDSRIWKLWEDVVGPAIASNAQPLRIKNRILKVRVSDPIWFQELKFMEGRIREKLNERLGREAVDKIEFGVGPRLRDE